MDQVGENARRAVSFWSTARCAGWVCWRRRIVNLRPEPALRRLTIGRRNRSARQGAPPPW